MSFPLLFENKDSHFHPQTYIFFHHSLFNLSIEYKQQQLFNIRKRSNNILDEQNNNVSNSHVPLIPTGKQRPQTCFRLKNLGCTFNEFLQHQLWILISFSEKEI